MNYAVTASFGPREPGVAFARPRASRSIVAATRAVTRERVLRAIANHLGAWDGGRRGSCEVRRRNNVMVRPPSYVPPVVRAAAPTTWRHKLSSVVSVFSTAAGALASDLEDPAAAGQPGACRPLVARLSAMGSRFVPRVSTLSLAEVEAAALRVVQRDRGR